LQRQLPDENNKSGRKTLEGNINLEMLPHVIPIMAVRNTVLFPAMGLPLSIGRDKSLRILSQVMESDRLIGVVAQRDSEVDDPSPEDLYTFGTLGRVVKNTQHGDMMANVLIHGITRFRIDEILDDEPYLKAKVTYFPEDESVSADMELQALQKTLKLLIGSVIQMSPNIPDEAAFLTEKIPSASYLADMVGHYLDLDVRFKEEILETIDIRERLERVTRILTRELEMLELGKKIHSQVRENIDKHQREAYLREQMKEIQRELGDYDGGSEDIGKLKTQIEEAGMSEEAGEQAMKELGRLERMHPSSPEYQVVRSYLDWLIELPWSKFTTDNLDLKEAERILDEDHYDLEKVKQRILEFLAVRKLKSDLRGPILCFQGPPGVGKTSLGKSIARALGRKFVRISLGGVRDEAEIRGHRRTYIGSLPGRIIKGIKKSGVNNPVFMLDEIDKLGNDFRGDPSSALLEVLDPEQNHEFSDHYLEVTFDLSKVLFICTANILDTVPPALRDRLEVIHLPGYTEEEKMHIARNFLIPENISEHGLTGKLIEFKDEAVAAIINNYTGEAGVRNLKREIAGVCRSVARDVAGGRRKKTPINAAEVEVRLGRQKFFSDVAERVSRPGVAAGLAWTPAGGDLLFIEATRMRGKGSLTLTGQMGDVMKESAITALSYVRSKAAELGIDEKIFQNTDLHIHVPAGAIPKDGPSAGVTMLTALASLLTGRSVNKDIAMTGEMTLRGRVLPVGGVKEKVLAARRAGIRTVLLPDRNAKDLDDISESSRRDMNFIFISEMDEVLDHAILKNKNRSRRSLKAN